MGLPQLRPIEPVLVPHDLDAEAAVLSALLLDPARIVAVARIVAPRDFYSDANRRIAEAIWQLDAAGAAVDVTTVASQLLLSGRLAQIGGAPYLAQLIDATPAVGNVDAHAQIVSDRAGTRHVIAACERASDEARSGSDIGAVMDRLHGAIEEGALSRSGELLLIGVPEIFAPLPPVPWLVEGLI
jgi:replicative DNA helicase